MSNWYGRAMPRRHTSSLPAMPRASVSPGVDCSLGRRPTHSLAYGTAEIVPLTPAWREANRER